MENQHRKITGYRELSEEEIISMNAVKDHAKWTEEIVDGVAGLKDADQRWVSIAKTHLQQGFMALTRAIAKPTSF